MLLPCAILLSPGCLAVRSPAASLVFRSRKSLPPTALPPFGPRPNPQAPRLFGLRANALTIRGGSLSGQVTALMDKVEQMETGAPLGFALLYVSCEILGIPAASLVVFAGAFFGVKQGVPLVLACGVLSAAICFAVGRRFRAPMLALLMRHEALQQKFMFVDKVIARGGFRALLLLRLVPTPFPLLNYVYGVTSCPAPRYLLATALGYAPGTLGLVYSGAMGKAILEGGLQQPWYVYLAAGLVLLGLLKLAADVATSTLDVIADSDKLG